MVFPARDSYSLRLQAAIETSQPARIRDGFMDNITLQWEKLRQGILHLGRQPALDALLACHRSGVGTQELAAELNHVRSAADACDLALDEVTSRLTLTGVSTSLVYDLERIRAQIRRLELLLEVWAAPCLEDQRKLAVLADLVRENHEHRSVTELLRQTLHLLTRRALAGT